MFVFGREVSTEMIKGVKQNRSKEDIITFIKTHFHAGDQLNPLTVLLAYA